MTRVIGIKQCTLFKFWKKLNFWISFSKKTLSIQVELITELIEQLGFHEIKCSLDKRYWDNI